MNSLRSIEFKVGFFSVLTVVMILFSVIIVDKSPLGKKSTKTYYTMVPDAAGIAENTMVKTNGINIGIVSRVKLVENQVRIEFELESDVILPKDTIVNIRTRGLLGDSYIDITRGDDLSETIETGGLIPQNTVSNDFNSLMTTLSAISRDVQQITGTLKIVLGSEETSDSLRDIISNLRILTSKITKGITENEHSFSEAMNNVVDITEDIKKFVNNNEGQINSFVGDMYIAGKELRQMSEKLGSMVTDKNKNNIETFIEKINSTAMKLDVLIDNVNQGKGTIGKLMNEDRTANNINDTLTDIRGFIKPMTTSLMIVDYKGEAFTNKPKNEQFRNSFGLSLHTSPDRSYLLGIVDDGTRPTTQTVVDEDGSQKIKTETVASKVELKYNFQFAKRWWDTSLRFGLFESSGGVAVDQYIFKDHLRFSVESFDFTQKVPKGRIWSEVIFGEHIYATLGMSNIYKPSNSSYFGGMGLRFTDDNIKSLMSFGTLVK